MSTSDLSKPVDMPASFLGTHHIKLPVYDLRKTLDFYTSILPLTHEPDWDHFTPQHERFAVIVVHPPTNLLMEIRHVPEHADKQRGWDPITWKVKTRADLDEWARWLDSRGVRRSKVFVAMKGWVLACEDPDGKIVRFYCEEEHEWTDHPDVDEYWLGTATA